MFKIEPKTHILMDCISNIHDQFLFVYSDTNSLIMLELLLVES